MFIIAKSLKGHEYSYSIKTAIKCKTKKEAQKLADFLNTHNDTAKGDFKLKETEVWFVHQIDKYDRQPLYRLKSTCNGIKVVYI